MERKAGKQITLLEMIEDCEKEESNKDLERKIANSNKIRKCPGGTDLSGE